MKRLSPARLLRLSGFQQGFNGILQGHGFGSSTQQLKQQQPQQQLKQQLHILKVDYSISYVRVGYSHVLLSTSLS